MQRPIKFRVWDKEREKLVRSENLHSIRFENPSGVVCYDYEHEYTSPIDQIILMQFTGLLDKNNKEIYEGDIIILNDNPIHEGIHLEVFFCIIRAQFIGRFTFGKYKDKFTNLYDDWRTYKVIGNKYENPELLTIDA